jgi:HK97 family phage prohead protease
MIVEGLASTTDLDLVNDIVAPGAFDKSITRRGLTGPKGIKFLFQHDRAQIIGRILELKPTNTGIRIKADVDENITVAAEAAKMIRASGGMSFSVGYRLKDADLGPRGEIIITEGDLFEVSVVTFPANPDAIMTAFKSGKPLDDIAASIRELKAITTTRDHASDAAANARRLTALLKG